MSGLRGLLAAFAALLAGVPRRESPSEKAKRERKKHRSRARRRAKRLAALDVPGAIRIGRAIIHPGAPVNFGREDRRAYNAQRRALSRMKR